MCGESLTLNESLEDSKLDIKLPDLISQCEIRTCSPVPSSSCEEGSGFSEHLKAFSERPTLDSIHNLRCHRQVTLIKVRNLTVVRCSSCETYLLVAVHDFAPEEVCSRYWAFCRLREATSQNVGTDEQSQGKRCTLRFLRVFCL